MNPVGASWYNYINKAMESKGWTLEKTMEYVKDLEAGDAQKAMDRLALKV